MPVIKSLDSRTVAKIAAGEVVERPLSAVKELIENAIDAGSSEIVVELEEGGMKRIAVSDNGCGMEPSDVELCVMSHTTSKLRDITDLAKLSTLGFRGEALCSMSAVSRLTVTSRAASNDIGHKIRVEGATRKLAEPAPRTPGTTIEVENLFFNVPARLKFQKSQRSEAQAVTALVSRFMIDRPEISFRLMSNGEELLNAPAAGSRMERIRHILGKDLASHLRQSGGTFRDMELTAFFSMPDLTFSNRKYQIFYVNGHIVKDRTLSTAVDVSYKGLISHGRFPLAILFLGLPASEADFNVHPAKTEIRFARPHDAHSLIYRTLRNAFIENRNEGESAKPFTLVVSPDKTARTGGNAPSPAPEPGQPAAPAFPSGFTPPRAQPQTTGQLPLTPAPSSSSGGLAPWEEPTFKDSATDIESELEKQEELVFSKQEGAHEEDQPAQKPAPHFEILGQFFNTFILARVDGKAAFIDQHVASERIIYNALKRSGRARPSQLTLLGEPVEVPRDAYRVLSENLELIKSAGLEVEPFGDRAFIVRSVVHNAGRFDAAQLLTSLASEISSSMFAEREDILDRLYIATSCELAIQGGQPLTTQQMHALVKDYLDEELNRTCPHGRPIMKEISHDEMKAWFKR